VEIPPVVLISGQLKMKIVFCPERFQDSTTGLVSSSHHQNEQKVLLLLRPESLSGMCAKLRTEAAGNNRVHMP